MGSTTWTRLTEELPKVNNGLANFKTIDSGSCETVAPAFGLEPINTV